MKIVNKVSSGLVKPQRLWSWRHPIAGSVNPWEIPDFDSLFPDTAAAAFRRFMKEQDMTVHDFGFPAHIETLWRL